MEFQTLIEKRKSIRQYDGNRKISREMILEMIKAAQLAPSWKNQQASRYYCVMDDAKMKEFRETCLPEFNANNAEHAAALIVTTFIKGRSGFGARGGAQSNELGDGWGLYDAGLQSENLVLKAEELGLNTLIMGIRDADEIRKMLNVPEEEVIVSVISVGYGTENPERRPRKETEDIVKFF